MCLACLNIAYTTMLFWRMQTYKKKLINEKSPSAFLACALKVEGLILKNNKPETLKKCIKRYVWLALF